MSSFQITSLSEKTPLQSTIAYTIKRDQSVGKMGLAS